MHFSVNPTRFAMLMALIVVISVVLYTLLWMPTSSIDFFLLPQQQNTVCKNGVSILLMKAYTCNCS